MEIEASGAITVPADYSQLGVLLIIVTVLGLLLPFATMLLLKALRWRSV